MKARPPAASAHVGTSVWAPFASTSEFAPDPGCATLRSDSSPPGTEVWPGPSPPASARCPDPSLPPWAALRSWKVCSPDRNVGEGIPFAW